VPPDPARPAHPPPTGDIAPAGADLAAATASPRPRPGSEGSGVTGLGAGQGPVADLVIGVGARPGVDAAEILALIDAGLRAVGATPAAVLALATVTARGDEPALLAAAHHHGWPLLAHPPALLAAVPVPHPGRASHAALGVPGVAEAACLLAPHPNPPPWTAPPPGAPRPQLLLPKQVAARATLAIARHPNPAPHDRRP